MIKEDIQFVKSILPDHYIVEESKKKGSIHCKSSIGIPTEAWSAERDRAIGDGHYSEWDGIFENIKSHFGERFQEVFHNTCTNHVDFTIYLKPNSEPKDKRSVATGGAH